VLFIGGIQPKTKILDSRQRRCPVCGAGQAQYRRVDHYLSFFFIPVLRVKKGEPFITCDRCQQEVGEMVQDGDITEGLPIARCTGCGRPLEPDYRYCPQCGKSIKFL
jgi:rubredoxin